MKIRPMELSELDLIAEHLGRTFAADPSLGWVVRNSRDPEGLIAAFYSIVTAELTAIGHIDTAWDGDEYLGSAIWMPPGAKLPRSVLSKAIRLVPRVGRAWLSLIRYLQAASTVKLPFPAWYLSVIAVEESARGRGVGSALLDAGLSRIGGEAARLEATSERAAKLYESRGFIRLGELTTPVPAPEINMWRPGQH